MRSREGQVWELDFAGEITVYLVLSSELSLECRAEHWHSALVLCGESSRGAKLRVRLVEPIGAWDSERTLRRLA